MLTPIFKLPHILWKNRGRLLLALTGILLALLILEVGVRLLLPPAPPSFQNYGDTYVCSPTVGWLGRPKYQRFITTEEFSHLVQFNSNGMYDTEHTLEKPDNVFRILWGGDSFGQSLQVEESQTAHQQLEDLLNQRLGNPDRSFEVISTGVMGWGTAQELVYYREQGNQYQPDLVLLLFYIGNDAGDNLPGHALTVDGFNCFAPYFPVCNGHLDPEPWYYIPGFDPAWHSCSATHKWMTARLGLIQQNSYLFARIEPLLLSLKPPRNYGREFGSPSAALYLPQESEEEQYGWQVTEGLLSQFNHEVRADAVGFGVVLISPREAVMLSLFTEEQRTAFYQYAPVFADAEIDRPNRRLAAFFRDQNIPMVDLQQPMIDYIAQTGTQLYLDIDSHWTVAGNRLAAELVFAWLVDNNLLAKEDHEQ